MIRINNCEISLEVDPDHDCLEMCIVSLITSILSLDATDRFCIRLTPSAVGAFLSVFIGANERQTVQCVNPARKSMDGYDYELTLEHRPGCHTYHYALAVSKIAPMSPDGVVSSRGGTMEIRIDMREALVLQTAMEGMCADLLKPHRD